MTERFDNEWVTLKVKEIQAIAEVYRDNPNRPFLWEVVNAGIYRAHAGDAKTAELRLREILKELPDNPWPNS